MYIGAYCRTPPARGCVRVSILASKGNYSKCMESMKGVGTNDARQTTWVLAEWTREPGPGRIRVCLERENRPHSDLPTGISGLQGYLAHQKALPPLGPAQGPRRSPTVWSWRKRFPVSEVPLYTNPALQNLHRIEACFLHFFTRGLTESREMQDSNNPLVINSEHVGVESAVGS